MALATVRLGPQMKMEQLISALNQNFALLENINRTQIFKDKTGVPRIILGEWPDGNYGLIISKPGVDVVKLFQ